MCRDIASVTFGDDAEPIGVTDVIVFDLAGDRSDSFRPTSRVDGWPLRQTPTTTLLRSGLRQRMTREEIPHEGGG